MSSVAQIQSLGWKQRGEINSRAKMLKAWYTKEFAVGASWKPGRALNMRNKGKE